MKQRALYILSILILLTGILPVNAATETQSLYHTAPLPLLGPAGNDTKATATLITGLTYNNQVDTTATTPNGTTADATDPNPVSCTDSVGFSNSLAGGWSTVWYKYKTPATQDESIQADTKNTNYDTYIAVYQGDASGNLPSYSGFVGCNDDSLDGNTSRISFVGTKDTWYYFEVAHFRCFEGGGLSCNAPTTTGGNLNFSVNITNIDVTIGGDLEGQYYLSSEQSVVDTYPVDGAMQIKNLNGEKIVASLNQLRRVSPTASEYTGISQSMGLPIEKLSNIYVMPRYDYTDATRLYDAVLIANMDTVDRDITVTIAGAAYGPYTLAPSESQYLTYPGVAGGPLVVSSDTGAKIIASLYELKKDPKSTTGSNGQSEMMGLPFDDLSDTYLIPIYFGHPSHASLKASLFVANADTVARDITIKIGGVTQPIVNLLPSTGTVLTYPVDGAVEISSASGAKIIASLNQLRRVSSTATEYTGISQSMALPIEKLSNIYVMPRYDYTDPTRLYDAVLIANMDTVNRDITVTIAGVAYGPYTLAPSESQYKTYPGVAGGPLVVSSDTGAKIIASLYELKKDPKILTGSNGQSEMMGLPFADLSDTYLIPIYFGHPSHASLKASLFIGAP